MARRRSSKTSVTHAYRVVNEDGSATCECGKNFDSDDDWRGDHYEELHDEKERESLENRDPAAEAEAQRRFDEAHAAMIAARDEAEAADGD
jgi:hypothetical protein